MINGEAKAEVVCNQTNWALRIYQAIESYVSYQTTRQMWPMAYSE
jgi:hypothetical protein